MAYQHADLAFLRPPRPDQSVYREDCTQCFRSIDDSAGLDVCLTCFNGGCEQHAPIHFQSTSHPFALNIKRTRKPVKKRDEPPRKMNKLAIAAETDEDRYDTKTSVKCYTDGVDDVPIQGHLSTVVDAVLKASTFARQAEVTAWEQEMIPCEHTLCLEQETGRPIASQDLAHCSMCDLNENLWLCLTCGNLGCGRAQIGGIGGNSHGLAHTDQSHHPVAVKLGSLTANKADIYCYACNEERIDPEIATHLAHWGINIADRVQTEKSLTELQIEQNLKWDFSMTTDDGQELKPLFGEGFTGLKNLGNSCYLASSVQCLFGLPAFQKRYYLPQEPPVSTQTPAEDLETQLRKMADGLLSGTYSKPDTDVIASEYSSEIPHQKGLAPAMFKHLVGKGHEDFSTMQQQDALQFVSHLTTLVTRSQHPANLEDPTKSLRFVTEQRLQCTSCKKVRYSEVEQDNIRINVPVRRLPLAQAIGGEEPPKQEFEAVTFKECLDIFTQPEHLEKTCEACTSKDGYIKTTLFKTFPETFVVGLQRFELVNWVPTKLDIPVIIGDEAFTLDAYAAKGLQPNEELLPESSPETAKWTPNPTALAQLEAMGFPTVRCEKALHATGNSDAEAAMTWLFSHMEDTDIDEPIDFNPPSSSSTGATTTVAVTQESLDMLSAMGIPTPQARKALKETSGDVARAVDWVFSHPDDQGDFGDDENSNNTNTDETAAAAAPAERVRPGSSSLPAKFQLASMICHKGTSIHAGHYVAFVKKQIPGQDGEEGGGKQWVLFNDEKVVKAVGVGEMMRFAYVYFFERVD